MKRSLRVLVLATALLCDGCSYALMRPAPVDHEQLEYVDCTSSRVAPVLDTLGVVEGVAAVLAVEVFASGAFTGHGGDAEVDSGGRAIQVAALGASAVFLVSAIHGFGSASECERAKALSYVREIEAAREARAVQAAPAVPAVPAAPSTQPPGCSGDADCKAGRVCAAGSCAWPATVPAPATEPVPATEPAPASAPTPAASPLPPGR